MYVRLTNTYRSVDADAALTTLLLLTSSLFPVSFLRPNTPTHCVPDTDIHEKNNLLARHSKEKLMELVKFPHKASSTILPLGKDQP